MRKATPIGVASRSWCPGRDLNSHGFPHTPLKRTCLPIPPPGHEADLDYLPPAGGGVAEGAGPAGAGPAGACPGVGVAGVAPGSPGWPPVGAVAGALAAARRAC